MKCTVIIPTRHRTDSLRETLGSLGQQSEDGFEVIVVVDGEDTGTHALASTYKPAYPLRWIFAPEHKGQASARNAGAAAAEEEVLIFLDDDTRPVPGWIHHHLKHHRANNGKRTIGVLGKILDHHVRPPRSRTEQYLRETREPFLSQFEGLLRSQSVEFSKVAAFGLNTSILRKTFLALGGFDPNLSFIDEDTDFGARLFNSGAQFTFEPKALVYHHETKDPIAQHYLIARTAGKVDVYRRREKLQHNGRLHLLAQLHNGTNLRKLVHRTAWYAPWTFQMAGSISRKVTDLTGSRRSFRLWYKTGAAEYWKGLSEAGETIGSLRKLFPPHSPVLMLHSIAKPEKQNQKVVHLSPERFRRFMGWLKRTGFRSILPTEWQDCTASGRRVILTFDDGYDDFLSEAHPVLDSVGFSATVFIVVDRIGKTNEWDASRGFRSRRLLSLRQIRELHRQGVHFGSHTLTHPWLTNLSDQDLEREISGSKHKLEDLLGAEVPCFSYPWGIADIRVRGAVARAGYKVAVSTQEGLNCWEDPLYLKRINICEVDTLPEFALKVSTGTDFRQKVKRYLISKGLYPDHGMTWQTSGGNMQNDEPQVFEKPDGTVMPRVTDAER